MAPPAQKKTLPPSRNVPRIAAIVPLGGSPRLPIIVILLLLSCHTHEQPPGGRKTPPSSLLKNARISLHITCNVSHLPLVRQSLRSMFFDSLHTMRTTWGFFHGRDKPTRLSPVPDSSKIKIARTAASMQAQRPRPTIPVCDCSRLTCETEHGALILTHATTIRAGCDKPCRMSHPTGT